MKSGDWFDIRGPVSLLYVMSQMNEPKYWKRKIDKYYRG